MIDAQPINICTLVQYTLYSIHCPHCRFFLFLCCCLWYVSCKKPPKDVTPREHPPASPSLFRSFVVQACTVCSGSCCSRRGARARRRCARDKKNIPRRAERDLFLNHSLERRSNIIQPFHLSNQWLVRRSQ
jgi:hypothetical protein